MTGSSGSFPDAAGRAERRTPPPIFSGQVETVEIGIEGLETAIKDPATVSPDGERLEASIADLEIRRARTHADERGTLSEIFDARWGFTDDPLVYAYHVTLNPGAIRGWVVHIEQYDRLFIYAGVVKVVLYDGRTDSETFGRLNVFHFGEHDRVLVKIPTGVYHALKNVGDREAAFVNMPSRPYRHDDPDKYRLPLDNDVIPYRLT